MPRRSHRRTRAFAQPAPATRLTSLLMMLFVLGLMYSRAKDPATWRWLAREPLAAADVPLAAADVPVAAADVAVEKAPVEKAGAERPPQKPGSPPPAEEVVAGPTDQDQEEWNEAQRLFGAISDRAALDRTEMPAYWMLLKWARAQTYSELASRARSDVLYTQFWEQPDDLRGKLVRLKLHVRRAMVLDKLAKNPQGLDHAYELWGPTDESKSYPYCVVVSELPAGLPVGGEVEYDVEFVGYFLKMMRFEAFDKPRPAPLLLGRIRSLGSPASRQKAAAQGDGWIWTGAGAIVLVGGAWLWIMISKRKNPAMERTSISEASVESWLTNLPPDEHSPVPPAGNDVASAG